MKSRPRIGLALGGGGARGIAHIGVLKVLEQEQISIDLIVGTSIGALVGAAYALNPDARALEERLSEVLNPNQNGKAGLKRLGRVQWYETSKSDFIRRIIRIAQKEMFLHIALFRNALLSPEDLRECVDAFVADVETESTKIPFGAVTADLISGTQQILRNGSIVRAVMASCAVAGFMPAVSWEDSTLAEENNCRRGKKRQSGPQFRVCLIYLLHTLISFAAALRGTGRRVTSFFTSTTCTALAFICCGGQKKWSR
jgi:NTE family protein